MQLVTLHFFVFDHKRADINRLLSNINRGRNIVRNHNGAPHKALLC